MNRQEKTNKIIKKIIIIIITMTIMTIIITGNEIIIYSYPTEMFLNVQ